MWEMIKTVGMGRRLDSLRFKCRNYGKHRVEFRMVSETGDHKPVVRDWGSAVTSYLIAPQRHPP